jgi:Aromatic acid exporter family member 1
MATVSDADEHPGLPQTAATQLTAAARVVAQRAPVTLTVVRHRAQPTAATIVRLTATAVFAYLIALPVPGVSRPVLAPLTALLVAQVSLFQTLRSALRRVGSVVAGVLVAVALSALVGFTWWTLGIVIVLALAVGNALHLGDHVLEVPISAMLILSSVGTRAAATGRVVETFIGTVAGLIAGFVLAAPKVQPAEEAVLDLCDKMAGLLDRISAGLADGTVADSVGGWLDEARSFPAEIRHVDDALREAEESTRLNPRSLRLPGTTLTLRETLETLEHEGITIRVLTRSLADGARLADSDSPIEDPEARRLLAGVLREISSAVMSYGRLAVTYDEPAREGLESELERQLAAARDRQDELDELVRISPADRPAGWPLRGELMSHLDRLRLELEAGRPGRGSRRHRKRPLRRPRPDVRLSTPRALRRRLSTPRALRRRLRG